jgi:PAS domain-containing protein/DNA-binding CsgD family transcriptional regulator
MSEQTEAGERFGRTIDAIYEAATDRNGWRGAVETVAASFSGVAAVRIAAGRNLQDLRSAEATIDPHYLDAYYAHYAGADPLTQRDRFGQMPSVVVEEALMPIEELRRSEFYADWMRPQDVGRIMRWRVEAPSGLLDLIILRSDRVGEFTAAEQRSGRLIVPHLKRAVEISDRVQSHKTDLASTQGALQTLPAPILIVDSTRVVRFANQLAEALLQRCDGLICRGGRIYGVGEIDQRFGLLLARATGGGKRDHARTGGILAVPRKRADAPLSVAVTPVSETQPGPPGHGPLALLVVSAPEQRLAVSKDVLRSLYDLTTTEARLLAALCTGQTLSGFANASGTALTTVKSHLAAAFLKTGERRQTDLVLRVMSDRAAIMASQTVR